MYSIIDLKVENANPPPTITIFFPFIVSRGHPLPKGPRIPIISPTVQLCTWLVTCATFLTVNSKYPFSVGDDAIPIGNSPIPMRLISANWPGMYLKDLNSSLFWKTSLNVFKSLTRFSFTISAILVNFGIYGFSSTAIFKSLLYFMKNFSLLLLSLKDPPEYQNALDNY